MSYTKFLSGSETHFIALIEKKIDNKIQSSTIAVEQGVHTWMLIKQI